MRELKQWVLPLDPNQVRLTSADAISSETLNGLRCILLEIEEASVLIAISASIAGALASGRDNSSLSMQTLAGYLPSSPESYRRYIDHVLKAALAPSIILPVQAYHARLSYALRLTRALADAGPAPTEAVHRAEIEKVDEAWRHVCGTALGAISVLRETLAAVRFSRPPVANEHAEALLRSAKAGGRPCVADNGEVRMPRWAENRAHARKVTEIEAMVRVQGGKKLGAIIENASRTGLGLNGIKDAAPGAQIAIELQDGELLSGKVMWVRGDRAGVHLEDILPTDHLLLNKGR